MLDVRIRLREAIIDGNVLVVKRILRRFPHHLKNINPENGWSSLHYAGYYGHYIICVSLVGLGHDNDEISLNFDNNAPIHTTVLSGNHQTLLMILQSFPQSLDLKGDRLRSPLHMAAVMDYSSCVDLLIEKGANINAIDADGNTPLHLAMMYGSLASIRLLLLHRAYIDVRNTAGWLPVEAAVDVETERWFNQLIEEVINKPKLSVMEIPTGVTDTLVSSYRTNLFSSYNSNSTTASVISQPVFTKVSRSDTVDSDPDIMRYKHGASPKMRKHSNSSPVAFNVQEGKPSHIADLSIEEEPHTPTYDTHATANSKSSSELSSMLSPVFPPSIPPAPGSVLSSPNKPFGSPFMQNTSPSAYNGMFRKANQDQGVFLRVRSNSNDVYNARKIPQPRRIHSNSVGTTSPAHHLLVNNGSNANFPDTAFKALLTKPTDAGSLTPSTMAVATQKSPQPQLLRGVKSSLSLNSPDKGHKSRSRASSVHNMINTPGRYRSNTILSYNSAISDKSKQSVISDKTKQNTKSTSKKAQFALDASQSDLASSNRNSNHSLSSIPDHADTLGSIPDDSNSHSNDLSAETHVIYLSDDDSGTDVDSSENEESPESPESQIPTFDIDSPSPKILRQKIKGSNTDRDSTLRERNQKDIITSTDKNQKDAVDSIGTKFHSHFLANDLRNTPNHRELAKFYSPNIDEHHQKFGSDTGVLAISPLDSKFLVNPFIELQDSRQNNILSANNIIEKRYKPPNDTITETSKRSSILSIPIMSMLRRRHDSSSRDARGHKTQDSNITLSGAPSDS